MLQSVPESRFRVQELGKTRIGLAKLAFYSGDAVAALTQFDEAARELEQVLGPDHPFVIDARVSQGSAAYRNQQTDAARAAWERALHSAQRVFDPDSTQIGTLNNNLGLLLFEEGDFDAAEPMLRATLESDRRHRIEDYADLAFPLYNLGFLLRMRGDADAAHDLWREGVDIAQAHGHRMLGPLLAALGDRECELGSAETGLPLAQRAVEVLEQAGDADAWRVAQARLSLAFCRARNGEHITRQQMTADMDELRQRWPNPANPFRQRAQSQFQTLSRP
ncbi:tetratricopeptide repeat protein [Xanthomonadaceae bacterium JHOS43]|nr:tetratricopeptide repeat protein [Xanthomonadaceae bacterium JHOS43]